jgi:hypothetical protein
MRLTVSESGDIDVLNTKLKQGATKTISRAIFLVMNYMETAAKKNLNEGVYQTATPGSPFKRTRKAQQSIVGQMQSSQSARVYMGVNYGKYIEEGTGIYNGRKPYWTTFGGILDYPIFYKGMKARPFWAPAIKETKSNLPDLLAKAAKDTL